MGETLPLCKHIQHLFIAATECVSGCKPMSNCDKFMNNRGNYETLATFVLTALVVVTR